MNAKCPRKCHFLLRTFIIIIILCSYFYGRWYVNMQTIWCKCCPKNVIFNLVIEISMHSKFNLHNIRSHHMWIHNRLGLTFFICIIPPKKKTSYLLIKKNHHFVHITHSISWQLHNQKNNTLIICMHEISRKLMKDFNAWPFRKAQNSGPLWFIVVSISRWCM